MPKKCHPLLEPMLPVVKLLGSMLGKDYEIVLHDVSGEEPFIVAIENGEVTDRDENSKMTDFGYFLMANPEAKKVEFLANYPGETENGHPIRSGVALIRDEDGSLVGFLCINFDMTRAQILKDMGDSMTSLKPLSFGPLQSERFTKVSDVSATEILGKARREFRKPLKYLDRKERVHCIEILDKQGFFNLKGAVRLLAKEMGKSRYTIYADLQKLRSRT
ncbi:MAG: YheO domain protein [Synergistales bacterium 53_16]|nr:MAG: YheO domain protein [Synergistales bacterium 53_16]